jgi:hypothetical protein
MKELRWGIMEMTFLEMGSVRVELRAYGRALVEEG